MLRAVKITAAGLAAGAAFVAGTIAPAHAAVNVASTVNIAGFNYSDDTGKVTFRGKAASDKAFCEVGRQITLKQIDDNVVAGHATTVKGGAWKVRFDGTAVNPGVFKAIMKEKVVKKDGRKYVCAADSDRYDASQG